MRQMMVRSSYQFERFELVEAESDDDTLRVVGDWSRRREIAIVEKKAFQQTIFLRSALHDCTQQQSPFETQQWPLFQVTRYAKSAC